MNYATQRARHTGAVRGAYSPLAAEGAGMLCNRLRSTAKALGVIGACTVYAALASDSYREAAAFGWHAAARVLSAHTTSDGLGTARVRISLAGPAHPPRDVTVSVAVNNGELPALAVQSVQNGGTRQPIAIYKVPQVAAPLVRVTLAQEGGRNTAYFDTFVQTIAGKLQEVPMVDLQFLKPDHARRLSSPARFSTIWKVASWDEGRDRVGGSSIQHHAIYRVTTPDAQIKMLSVSIETQSVGIDTGTPDPKATPFVDKPLLGQSFCLWHELETPPAQPPYYAPCV